MKTLIVYASKHGSAEKAANKLYQNLGDDKEIVNIQENSKPFIDNFDTVVIGGSIYGGNIQKEIQKFINDNLNTLLDKRIGLYLCCGIEKDFEKQLENSISEKLLAHTAVVGYFGYEYNIDKMNLLEKGIDKLTVRNIAKKAGYSYATIYNYFNNSDELMWAIGLKVLENLAQLLHQHYEEIKNSVDNRKLIKSVYREYIDYFLENESLYHFIFLKNINVEAIRKDEQNHPPILYNLQQEIMENFVKKGIIKREEAIIAGDLLTNSINGLLSLYFSGKENISKKNLYQKANQYIDYIISG